MTHPTELTVTRIIPTSQKEAFEAWLDPKVLPKFMLPGEGMGEPKVEVDARVGGSFLILMKAGDQELPHRGEYKEIKRYDRLVFTWLSVFTIPDSTVTLTFEKLGPKETKIVLHHVGFPNEDSRKNHEGGWSRILEMQSKVLG